MKKMSEANAANSKRMMLMLAIAFAHGAVPTTSLYKRAPRCIAAEPLGKAITDSAAK